MEHHRAVIDDSSATLDDVDVALVRLSEGTYRTCETCGEPLSDELLEGSPTRRQCDQHAAS